MNNGSIGLFDSGLGGLTVLRALWRRLPTESFIYLADTARFPYGPQPAAVIQQYALENALFLLEKGIKLLIIPCHTASVAALELLQCELPIPVIGMLDASLSALGAISTPRRIALLATAGTLASQVYQTQIHLRAPHIHLFPLACPQLVTLAEEYAQGDFPPNASEIVRQTLSPLPAVDAYLLGCTHFPLLHSLLNAHPLIDPAEECAKQAQELLTASNQLNSLTSPVLEMHTTCNRKELLSVAWKVVAQKSHL